MNRVVLICLVAIFATLVGQAAAQDYQITWHNSNLEACQILDQQHYYAAGWTSTTIFRFIKSTDAGQNWQSVEVSHLNQIFRVKGLWMTTPQIGWICGDNYGLYQTTDGGNTWVDASNRPGVRNNSSELRKIRFVSPQVGYILSSGDLKKTTDGGNTWTTIKANQVEAGEGGFNGFDVLGETIILSAMRYNANDLANCHVSQDGGLTWQLSFVNRSDFSYNMKIASANIFYASISDTRELFRSIDGGATWQLFLSSPNGGGVGPLSWTNNTLYVASGCNGNHRILKVNNDSWQEVVALSNTAINGFDFRGSRGMTVGYDGSITTFTDTTVETDDPVTPATPEPELTCYPNPFRGSTNIKFNQVDNSPNTVAIYNTRGQLVRTLVSSQKMSPGEHSLSWDGKDDRDSPVAAGIYLCRLVTGQASVARRMIMLK